MTSVNWSKLGIAEDYACHLGLLENNIKVNFLPSAVVTSAAPKHKEEFSKQRERWEGGRLSAIKKHFFSLVQLVYQGNRNAIEPLWEMTLLPLSFHVLLISLTLLAVNSLGVLFFALSMIVVIYHLLTIIKLDENHISINQVFKLTVSYLLWKIFLLFRVLISANDKTDWKGTRKSN